MSEITDKNYIPNELSLLKDRLQKNEQLFNLAEEEAVIEALIFERKAIMLRYSAAIEKAKKECSGGELLESGGLKWRK